mmetsp:Transcript_88473/g.235374  ORF Transcript_88473/g.235374 Transcript_88473/m.235374 type:complete len:2151 (+) Transcript_88473:23-6475(+)
MDKNSTVQSISHRQDPNDWIPQSEDVGRDAALHLPNIVAAILKGCDDRDWFRSVRQGVHALRRYLDLKHFIPRQDRALLAVRLYNAATSELDLDQNLQKTFAQTTVRLLKRREGERLAIELPWRPIYKVLDRLFFGKARISQTPLCPYLSHYMVKLARTARAHFPPGSAREIIDELRPSFCAPCAPALFRAQAISCLLLPRAPPHAPSPAVVNAGAGCAGMEEAHMGAGKGEKEGLEETDKSKGTEAGGLGVAAVLGLWGWVVAHLDWDLGWVVLLASARRHTYVSPREDWEPYVPAIFSHLAHVIDLPFGPSKIHIYTSDSSISSPEGFPFYSFSNFAHIDAGRTKVLQVVHKASKLIVYLLPRGGGLATEMLRRLARAIESFLHPSNNGYWTHRIAQLLASLTEYFAERVHREQQLSDDHPAKLTPSDMSDFVDILLPLSLQGLYSKSTTACLHSCSALRRIASLAPHTVLPPLLERACHALSTLTEVHQTTAALDALTAVSHTFLQPLDHRRGISLSQQFSVFNAGLGGAGAWSAAGVGQLAELMELTLGGIDGNDLYKTWATLRLYTALLSGLPLLPLPEVPPSGVDPVRHDAARQAAEAFGDWALRFLDQALVFITNHSVNPQAEEVKKADSDTRTSEYFFHCTLEVFFMQLGEDLFEAALSKVVHFCLTRLLPPQQQVQLGAVLSALTAVDPPRVAAALLPTCLRLLLPAPPPTPRVSSRPNSFRGMAQALSPMPQRAVNGTCCSTMPPSPLGPVPLQPPSPVPSSRPHTGIWSSFSGKRTSGLSEREMVYYLSAIQYVAEAAGDSLLPYKDDIHNALDEAMKAEERPGVPSLTVVKAAHKLIRSLLHSLLTCRLRECRCVPKDVWTDPAWRSSHHMSWGCSIPLEQAAPDWHVPSAAGRQWAADLATRYLDLPVSLLRRKLHEDSNAESTTTVTSECENHSVAQSPGLQSVSGGNNVFPGTGIIYVAGGMTTPSASHPPPPPTTAVTWSEMRIAVTQIRFVLEGIVASLPDWNDEHVSNSETTKSHCANEAMSESSRLQSNKSREATGAYSSDAENQERSAKRLGREDYCAGTWELPSCWQLSRVALAEIVRDCLDLVLRRRPEDARLLQALAKLADVLLNGVDVLQKKVRRMRLRYSLLKSRHCETVDPDAFLGQDRKMPAPPGVKMMPRYLQLAKLAHHHASRLTLRQRKSNFNGAVLQDLLGQVTELSIYPYSSVRSRANLALLSACRRYQGAAATALPRLLHVLHDKHTADAGHEQRVMGAAVLLQTRYCQNRIMRDWAFMRQFLLALCQADHNDKETVVDALDSLFSTFLSYWYQLPLEIPAYAEWRCPKSWPADEFTFPGYANLLERLVGIVQDRASLNWRFKLMVFDAVSVMLRDDVGTPTSVLKVLLEGAASDIAHVREACFPALANALELAQTSQHSKEVQDIFPDKAYHGWNGFAPERTPDTRVREVRQRAYSPEHDAEAKQILRSHIADSSYREKLASALSIIQLGRAKSFVGSHAQLFKGLFKALGPELLIYLRPLMEAAVADPQAHSKLSSDIFMGQQCFAAEVMAGLVRGFKYWNERARNEAQDIVAGVLGKVLLAPETESVGVWSSALRFCCFDRHPRRLKFLLTALFDDMLPHGGQLQGSSSVLVFKRLHMVKPVVRELSWRGSPLQRQLLHDLEPLMTHPLAQARTAVGACLAVLSRAAWSPPVPPTCAGWNMQNDHRFSQSDDELKSRNPHLPSGDPTDAGSAPLQHVCAGNYEAHAWRHSDQRQPDSLDGWSGEAKAPPEVLHQTVTYLTSQWSLLSPATSKHPVNLISTTQVPSPASRHSPSAFHSNADMCSSEDGERQRKERLRNLRHTLVLWMSSTTPEYDALHGCPLQQHLPVLAPILLQALEDRDADIARQAKSGAEMAANAPQLATHVLPDLLASVRAVARSESWQVRAAVLPFLQICVFRHQFVIAEEDMAAVQRLVVELLGDTQVEVREMASAAVSVLVRISGSPLALDLRDLFLNWANPTSRNNSTTSIGRNFSSIRCGGKLSSTADDSCLSRSFPQGLVQPSFGGDVVRRHAGVLGLAGLVGAYPYDVPAFMPEVLVQLAEFVQEPMPIRQTVRNAFGEFWRTHQDAWPVLKERFTEDQLLTLTNLLASPAYFS